MLITVDGQSSTGKSSLAAALASELDFHFLGSGSMYRLLALLINQGEPPREAVKRIAKGVEFRYQSNEMKVIFEKRDITGLLNSIDVAQKSSLIAKDGNTRALLTPLQHQFNRPPGLVAEGRDMGTVIFPSADIKFFLRAEVEIRAARRHKQLLSMGIDRSIDLILQQLKSRDRQDETRDLAPLVPASDAIIIDSSQSWDETLSTMINHCQNLG